MSDSPVAAETRDRIEQVANRLYEEAGGERFPTVDAVRRGARVDMNSVTLVMREWRRARLAQAAPAAVAVPEALAREHMAALAALWTRAQEMAVESLRAAQAGWEAERAELDALQAETAQAFEAQAQELEEAQEAARASVQALDSEKTRAATELALERDSLVKVRAQLQEAQYRVRELESELVRVRGDLKTRGEELAGVQAQLAKDRAQAQATDAAHQEQKRVAAAEVQRQAERLTRAKAERDEARRETSAAREEAARLAGQVEALQGQVVGFMARLRPEKR